MTRQIIIEENNEDDDDVEEDKMRRLVVIEPTLWIGLSLRGYGERGEWGPQSAHRCQLVLFTLFLLFFLITFLYGEILLPCFFSLFSFVCVSADVVVKMNLYFCCSCWQ